MIVEPYGFTSSSSFSRPSRARSVLICFVSLLAVSFAGCFRYTPSRSEMGSSDADEVAGPEAFKAYQSGLQRRLESLIAERSRLLQAVESPEYEIGKGDVLKVEVFGFSDLGGDCSVGEDGTVTYPLIGPVEAEGKSVGRMQGEITARYLRYVRNPKIRLSVTQYNSRRVSVVGAVVHPGWVPLKRTGYLLTELLAEVGGVKENAGGRVYLIPSRLTDSAGAVGASATEPLGSAGPAKGASAGVEIDLEELNGTLDKPPLLIPLVAGDTVIVPEAGQFRVDGEVTNPGSFAVSRRTSALGAIAAAGGFTYAANVNEVEVIRDIGAGKKAALSIDLEKVAFRGAPDVSLRDGDIVIVPSAPGAFRARQVVEAFRSIMRGGVTGSIRYQ